MLQTAIYITRSEPPTMLEAYPTAKLYRENESVLHNTNSKMKDESRTLNFQKKYFICFNKSPLKMMKMLFIPFQKLSLFSRNSIFFVDFLVIQKKQRLHQKDKGNLTFMMSQLCYQTLHTLRNISLSKGNQTMIYGQVIKYMGIFFFKDHAENEAGRLFSDLYYQLYMR